MECAAACGRWRSAEADARNAAACEQRAGRNADPDQRAARGHATIIDPTVSAARRAHRTRAERERSDSLAARRRDHLAARRHRVRAAASLNNRRLACASNMNNYSFPAPDALAPTPRAGHKSALRTMLVVAAILVALLLGLLTLLLIGLGTGLVPLLIGFVLATIPVPIYVALALWIDRFEPEPPWTLATAFFWGALVAIFIAFVMNTLSGIIVALVAGDQAGELFAMVVSAPFVEEISKALILFGLFWWKRVEFDGVFDGIVYAAIVCRHVAARTVEFVCFDQWAALLRRLFLHHGAGLHRRVGDDLLCPATRRAHRARTTGGRSATGSLHAAGV